VGKKIIAGILIILGLSLVGFGIYRYLESRKPDAGLKIETTPESLVFVDNVQLGQTPIDKVFKQGEVSLKIIPNSTSSALTTYQTKVRLNSHVYSVVKRDFGPTETDTAGEIVTLEPQSGKLASLSVVTSSPDSASVSIDGEPQGFSPVLVPSLPPGDHEITISSVGFKSRSISAIAVAGYKLIINAKLAGEVLITPTPAPSLTSTPSGTPKVTPKKVSTAVTKPYVEIKDTPTGFLRVRSQPNTAGKELGRVNPAETYHLLEEKSGWYLIQVEVDATSSGWISAQYADKHE
jgi:CRISPR/Cas system-associated exonuclease Cas4 (RecB family)